MAWTLGCYFLVLPMTWLYFGYVRPPVFSKDNYKTFSQELYTIILKGSETELPVIASELARSASSLVTLCTPLRRFPDRGHEPDARDYAHDLILLLGNRKLCRHIVTSCPVTAMAFFEQMTVEGKYAIPIGAFASNISTEAIINKDSILYHEGDGYSSGLMGYRKDFSQAIYGNFMLVEALASDGRSPLDIPFEIVRSLDAEQWSTYGRAIRITLKDYLDSNRWDLHSYALIRSLHEIEHSCSDVYKLAEIERDYYSSDIFRRLEAAVDFVKETIDLIGRHKPLPQTLLRVRDKKTHNQDLYDHIAKLMFELIFDVSSIKQPSDKCWTVHYNTVWNDFFTMPQGAAWRIVQQKLADCYLMKYAD